MTPPQTPKRAPRPKNGPRSAPRTVVQKTPPTQVTAATTDSLRSAAGALLLEYLAERPIADTAARVAMVLWRAGEDKPPTPSEFEQQLEAQPEEDLRALIEGGRAAVAEDDRKQREWEAQNPGDYPHLKDAGREHPPHETTPPLG